MICGEERETGFLYYVLSVSWGGCNEQCVVKADERIGTAAVSLEVPNDPPTSLGTGDSVGHGDAVAFMCTDPGVEGNGGAVRFDCFCPRRAPIGVEQGKDAIVVMGQGSGF